jgi:hypothetical protein
MIRAARQYLLDEVFPRWRSILKSEHLWLAFVLGGIAAWRGEAVFAAGPRVPDAVTALLTYGAIALGFCIAGLTVALTLPDREFARKLATEECGRPPRDAYSDLLFVFSWTAIVHWVVIVALVIGLAFARDYNSVLCPGASIARRFSVGIVVGLSTYGFFQFLVTLITISQVGRTYIHSLRQKVQNDKK